MIDDRNETTTEDRKTVMVVCGHANGLQLRLYKNHHVEGMPKMADPESATVDLKGGGNVVDAAFMDAWLKENEGNDLVLNGTISISEPQDGQHDGEPGVDNIVEEPEKASSIDAPAPKTEDDK